MTLTEISASTWRVESAIGNRNLYQYILVDQGQAVIIDAGMASTAREEILPAVRKLGLSLEAVTAIVVTHCDLDHQGGLSTLKQALPGALAICGFHDRGIVSEPERLLTDRYGAFEYEHGIGYTAEEKDWMRGEYGDPVELDLTLGGGELLTVAERKLRVLHAPGHSPGHVVLHEPSRGLLFSADAIHWRMCPAIDGSPALPPTYEDVAPYRATISLVRALAPTELHSGHWPARGGNEIEQFLDESEQFLTAIESALRERLELPASLDELCDHVEGRLGPFGADAVNLMFAVHGHLEALLRDEAVVLADWSRRPPRYRLADQQKA